MNLTLGTLGRALGPTPSNSQLAPHCGEDGFESWFQNPAGPSYLEIRVENDPDLCTPSVTRPSGRTWRRGYHRGGIPELERGGGPRAGLTGGGRERDQRSIWEMEGTQRGRVGQVEDHRGRRSGEVGWDGAGLRSQPPPPRPALLCVLQEVPQCLNTPDSLVHPFMPLLGGGTFPLFIISLVTWKTSLFFFSCEHDGQKCFFFPIYFY